MNTDAPLNMGGVSDTLPNPAPPSQSAFVFASSPPVAGRDLEKEKASVAKRIDSLTSQMKKLNAEAMTSGDPVTFAEVARYAQAIQQEKELLASLHSAPESVFTYQATLVEAFTKEVTVKRFKSPPKHLASYKHAVETGMLNKDDVLNFEQR